MRNLYEVLLVENAVRTETYRTDLVKIYVRVQLCNVHLVGTLYIQGDS